MAHVDGIVLDVKSGKGIVGKLLKDGSETDVTVNSMLNELLEITKEVRLGAGRFAENMEALKRNWLFSTYFEERGYYDKSGYEIKLEDYIEQINNKIKDLDERIKTLKDLEKKSTKGPDKNPSKDVTKKPSKDVAKKAANDTGKKAAKK